MTDQELVELFWQRREEALTGLQDKYGGWCRSIAGRILGEERDVEECLGDCWLQLWNAIPPARPQHFQGYLGAVVRQPGPAPPPAAGTAGGHGLSGRSGAG